MRTSSILNVGMCMLGAMCGIAQDGQPAVTVERDRLLDTRQVSGDSAFSQLLQIGANNRIPVGIVIGAKPQICVTPLTFRNSQLTIASLVDNVNNSLNSYRADLTSSVLYVHPKDIPTGADVLLKLKLPLFTANPGSLDLQATDLWLNVRGILAPTEGTAYVLPDTSATEGSPGFQAANQSVLSILNIIVLQEHGGAWVMDSNQVKQLSSHTLMPFSIRGYMGGENGFASHFRCQHGES